MTTGKFVPGVANRREDLPERLGRSEVIFGGYQGNNIPDDFNMPSADIEDVDRALFRWFDESLNLQVNWRGVIKQVPTIFAGAERYALTKSGRPIRNKQGAIIVPVVSIRRTKIMQGSDPSMAFGCDTGDLIIKRKLSPNDRQYQQLVNRFGLQNQDNVASDANVEDLTLPMSVAKPGRIASRRSKGEQPLQTALNNPLGNNIFEIITIPTPNMMTMYYTITIWTSYTIEMNQILERMLNAYEVGTQYTARIETNKGYWYVAHFGTEIVMEDNFDDYGSQKRLVKCTMDVKVPAYTLANAGPGGASPFRRYLSAPSFDFEVSQFDQIVENLTYQMPMVGPEDAAFLLSDVEYAGVDGRREDPYRRNGLVTREYMYNPFATTTAGDHRFAQIVVTSAKGERVGKIGDALLLIDITQP